LALIYYTGGTTGRPKGVMLTHANMEANSINVITAAGFDENTVHLHCGPLFHVAAGARIFSVTRAAGTHVMLPRFDTETVLQTIERERVTVATFVPTMARDVALRLESSPRRLPSLKLVSYGGAPTPRDTIQRLMRALPGVGFLQSYGQTECAPVATLLDPRDHEDGGDAERLDSVGRAALLAEIRIVDGEDRDLPPRTVGEVLVRGPMVMRGYWGQPETSGQALRGGWLHTGDMGFLDEHQYLHVVDRLKDMIISGGENVYSIEVENALYRHPAVAQAAVFGIPHPRWGEAVHAVVVLKPGAIADEAGLREHCKTLLAGYKCPLKIDIRAEALPLSGANKILKSVLRAPFCS